MITDKLQPVLKLKIIVRSFFLLILASLYWQNSFGQSFLERSHLGVGFGGMKYYGDIPGSYTKFAFQGNFTYELTDHFNLRVQGFWGSVGASGESNGKTYVNQNGDSIDFHSKVKEASLLVEYNLLNMNEGSKWTPYVFAGIGYFHYDPYQIRYNADDNRFYERHYWHGYYKSNSLAIPFGAGIKYGLTDNIRLSLEANVRYANTNYLDAYNTPPNNGKDMYYSGIIGISFRLGGDYSSRNGGGRASRNNRNNCPPVY